MKTKLLALLIALEAAAACRPARPASDASNLRDNNGSNGTAMTGTQNVTVTMDAGGKYTFKPERSELRLTELRELSMFAEKRGKVGNLKAKSWITLPAASFAVELAAQPDLVCKSVAPNMTTGVGLKGSVPFNCASQAEQKREIKEICRELSADTTIATFEDAKDSCYCPKRRVPELRYADYVGRKSLFRAECKNVATKPELKQICTEIQGKYCKTCKIEELSCECPKGQAVQYSQYLNDPEGFRTACLDGVTPLSGDQAQQADRFRAFCNAAGGTFLDASRTNSGRVECECRAQRRYTVEDYEYYKDREDTFRSLCLSE